MLSSCSKRLLLHDPIASWSLRLTHGGYNDAIRDISWSDDGKYLLQVNPRGLIEVLNTTDTEVRSLQHIPLRETWAACFHRDGHRNIAVGSKNGHVSVWDTRHKNICKTFPLPMQPAAVNILSFNAKNTNLAATMQNGDTTIYGTTSNSPVLTVKVPRSKSISAMKFHHESRSLLGLATDEGHMLLRDITTNKDKVFFKSIHASPVSDFSYSQINRDVLMSCGYDKIVRVYDVRNENIVSNIETNYPLTSLAMNLDNQVALGSRKGVVLVYDLRNLDKPLVVIDDHTDEVRRVTFQPSKYRILPTELSLKEDTVQIMSPLHNRSPLCARTPDIFLACDTPSPKLQNEKSRLETDRADSFLFKLGLDKSTTDDSFCLKKSVELGTECKLNTTDVKKWDTQSIAKSSTPVTGRGVENFLTPSFCEPLLIEDRKSQGHIPVSSTAAIENAQADQACNESIRELGAELRNLIKMSVADLAEDNRNYYLNLLMQLTKQKLFMESQMSALINQIQSMQHNQDALTEENRKLAMEIELLKGTRNNY